MLGGITGVTQKQGNTEAVPVGRKRQVVALFPNYIIAQSFNTCQ
jgi:hypothetical protein